MKRTLSAAAILFVLLSGCRDIDEKKSAVVAAEAVHEHQPVESQTPYFYGLIEEYQTVLAEDPSNLAAVIGLGNAYFDSGAWRDAIARYERALKLDPRNADVRTDMGTCYRYLGMPERALAEYRRALEYEPGHLNARYNMGIVYAYDMKNYTVAIHIWQELLRLSPNHPHADYMRMCITTFRKTLRKAGS